MIQRIRRPDGTRRDIDHGPGWAAAKRRGPQPGYPLTHGSGPSVEGLFRKPATTQQRG